MLGPLIRQGTKRFHGSAVISVISFNDTTTQTIGSWEMPVCSDNTGPTLFASFVSPSDCDLVV